MRKLAISLACQNSDRTRALIDGRVRVEGVDFIWIPVDPEEIFHRAFRHQEFDVCEISLATHITLSGRGGSPFIGVPAFLSRAFRHSAIYVRKNSEIASPADLRGKRVGTPDYQQTAALWVRGMMMDEFNVRADQVSWFVGGLEQPGREPRFKIDLPERISIAPIAGDATLSGMLLNGELDAIISPRLPSAMSAHPDLVGRMFSDFRSAEEDYFQRRGLFPLMHAVGVRRPLAEKYPWLAASLFKAFQESKEIGMRDMLQVNFMRSSLPWLSDDVAKVQQVMGKDYWKYGVMENMNELDAMSRYAHEDGLTPRRVCPDELFSPTTSSMFKI